MADFLISFRKTMSSEGGLTDNPADRGKRTYRGISEKWHPTWPGWGVINELSKQGGFPRSLDSCAELALMVQQFYRIYYWNVLGLEKLKHQAVADKLFDIAVNMGESEAATIAQRSVNLMNKNQALFSNLKVDGKLGDWSMGAINKICMMKENHDVFLKTLSAFQAYKYISICERDESQETFFIGWLRRA